MGILYGLIISLSEVNSLLSMIDKLTRSEMPGVYSVAYLRRALLNNYL